MAEAKFFQYKGKPLVRCGDTIYYGDMNDSFVIKMVIKSKQPAVFTTEMCWRSTLKSSSFRLI